MGLEAHACSLRVFVTLHVSGAVSDLPNVICFVLHNYCELNNESVNADTVRSTISYDQPETVTNQYMTDCNETEGKRIRRILTNYFDP